MSSQTDSDPLESDSRVDSNVDPWTVEGEVDYGKLVEQFGCELIDKSLISRIEKLTGRRAHPFLRRGLFYAHRDLHQLLDEYERGNRFYLYTGRGASSGSLHFGHLVPFMFTKWLQEAFDVPLVVQMTDDEKFLWKDITVEQTREYLANNVRDIVALGFDASKTFIFNDFGYIAHLYENIVRIQKCVTANQARGIFGFDGSSNIGKWAYPAVQAAPSFSSSFPHIFGKDSDVPCLIPSAIDQDPFFRMTRDVAPRLGYRKPHLIQSKFFPALQGPNTKMGSSVPSSAIFVDDSPKQIKDKINKYAFSGGQATAELQREKGANLEVDVAYQWLRFFLEDDEELESIGRRYASGELLTGEVKARLIQELQSMAATLQANRALITDDMLDAFMTVRKMEF